jgi:hypothetical protein
VLGELAIGQVSIVGQSSKWPRLPTVTASWFACLPNYFAKKRMTKRIVQEREADDR